MQRLLVVNVNWIGDVVMTTPVFRALRREFPSAWIACLAMPRVIPVLECCPEIDEIIVNDEEGRHHGIIGMGRLVLAVRKKRFDAVFLLHRSRTRAALMFLAGIPVRVGYNVKRLGPLLTHVVDPLAGDGHKRDHYCQVLESFGIPVPDRVTQLVVPEKERSEIASILRARGIGEDESVVVLHVGANWELKRWPTEHVVRLIRLLQGRTRMKIILSGGKADEALARSILAGLNGGVVSFTGQLSLRQLVALLGRAAVVVSGDSGPMHIASSVGANVVAVFGPTSPEHSGPCGPGAHQVLRHQFECNRYPCYEVTCDHHRCMRDVTPDEVCEAVVRMISIGEGGR